LPEGKRSHSTSLLRAGGMAIDAAQRPVELVAAPRIRAGQLRRGRQRPFGLATEIGSEMSRLIFGQAELGHAAAGVMGVRLTQIGGQHPRPVFAAYMKQRMASVCILRLWRSQPMAADA